MMDDGGNSHLYTEATELVLGDLSLFLSFKLCYLESVTDLLFLCNYYSGPAFPL